ncbi:MAG: hypothetical protein ABEH66_04520 [Halobacteriales archaeon]
MKFQEPLLIERLAGLFGFEWLSETLPGDIYPPYLFAGFFLFVDHGIVNVYIHLTGGTHVLIDFPNIVAGPPAVLFAGVGIRYMTRKYETAIADIRLEDRLDRPEDLSAFTQLFPWRVKLGIYVVAIVVLYANILFAVGLENIGRPGGGRIELVNWLFIFEFVYLPFIIEFGLVYYGVHFLVPRRLKRAEIGLSFFDPLNMGGFAELGQLLKRSYYLYTAGLLLFFVVVYGGVIFSFGGTPAGLFELVFFSAAWLVGVVSIGYSMFTMHRIMYGEKKQRIRELEDEMQEIIENPYDITESTVTDEGELEDIRRRLDEVRATRVYPATFTMWSQIAISVLLPQVMQLGVQATL